MKIETIIKYLYEMPEYVSLGIGCSALIIVLLVMASDRYNKKKKNKIKCLRKSEPEKAHGIIFGKKGSKVVYSPVNDEGFVGVFSATGTGKTSAIGIPTLRSWTGNYFAIDISGDISKNVSNVSTKRMLIYEPENEKSLKYNVFGPIDELKEPEKNEALAELVHLIAPDDPNMTGAAKFFYEGGREILMAAFISFYHKGLDFIDICKKINNSGWKDLFNEIDSTGYGPGIAHLSGFDPDRAADNAGCMQDAKRSISLYATNHKIIRSLGRPVEKEPYVAGKQIEKYSIMIVIEEDKLELYSPLLNLIVSQQMQYISTRKVTEKSPSILISLDEFPSIRLNSELILACLRRFRKRKTRAILFCQNLSDLDILYGHEITRAILANLKFKVLLGGLMEPESQKYFAELIGYKTKKRHSKSTNAQVTTMTESENREYVIEPADLDRLGTDVALLLFPSNSGYMKLKKNYYFA